MLMLTCDCNVDCFSSLVNVTRTPSPLLIALIVIFFCWLPSCLVSCCGSVYQGSQLACRLQRCGPIRTTALSAPAAWPAAHTHTGPPRATAMTGSLMERHGTATDWVSFRAVRGRLLKGLEGSDPEHSLLPTEGPPHLRKYTPTN